MSTGHERQLLLAVCIIILASDCMISSLRLLYIRCRNKFDKSGDMKARTRRLEVKLCVTVVYSYRLQ